MTATSQDVFVFDVCILQDSSELQDLPQALYLIPEVLLVPDVALIDLGSIPSRVEGILSYLHEMPVICHCSQLELLSVLSCRTFIALSHVKAHPVTFRKSFESGHVDCRVVKKYVPCVILLNEATPLVFTVPLYSSFCHSADLLKKFCFKPKAATLAKETILKGPSDSRTKGFFIIQKITGFK